MTSARSVCWDSSSSSTLTSAPKRPRTSDGADLGANSESKYLKRSKDDGGNVCCDSVLKSQVLSPKLAGWTESSSVSIFQGNQVSKKRMIEDIVDIYSTTKDMDESRVLDAEKSPTGGKHGSLTKAIKELSSRRKRLEAMKSMSSFRIPEIINLEDDDESQDKSQPTTFIDLTAETRKTADLAEANPNVESTLAKSQGYAEQQRSILEESDDKIGEAKENVRTNSDYVAEHQRNILEESDEKIGESQDMSQPTVFIDLTAETSKTADLAEAYPNMESTLAKSQGYAEQQRSILEESDEKIEEAKENVRTNSDDYDEHQRSILEELGDKVGEARENFRTNSDDVPEHRRSILEESDEKIGEARENFSTNSDDVAAVSIAEKDERDKVSVPMEVANGKSNSSFNDLANVSTAEKDKGIRAKKERAKEQANPDVSDDVANILDVQKDKRNRKSLRIAEAKENSKSNFNGVASVSKVKKSKGATSRIERAEEQTDATSDNEANLLDIERDRGEYVGVEDDEVHDDSDNDGLGQYWAMLDLESKADYEDPFGITISGNVEREVERDCDHSFIMKDDIGSVCRVCGLIEKEIGSIIELHFGKSKRSGRTYSKYERTNESGSNQTNMVRDGTELDDVSVEVFVHPRHQKVMKDHQYEGIRFLKSNLMNGIPGGCVMAHAPGSGKTFMIISFLQIFMSKYPSARPLIVLPRGILSTWKKEFQKWQIEDLPLYDFYSAKAENRNQQLEILRKWGSERSILFLSYKQFTVIVCDNERNNTTISCQEFLLETPSILILDEGHTPRNDDTETLTSLQKVMTPRKVVLSGTLYQNHVKEVFNVLNLVRHNFLKTDEAKAIKTRIMSKVTAFGKRSTGTDEGFFEAVEHTILDDIKCRKKVHIIQDMREMTRNVLHYYKGDSLDELPGLVDFTVFLKLIEKQKKAIEVLKQCKNRFKIIAEGSSIYVHPHLNSVIKQSGGNGKIDAEKIDELLLENMNEVGAKAKFYLNLLGLCESTGEKLLVFSQYLGPLKFLERLTVKLKNYIVGREIFVITGDSDAEIRDSAMENFNTSPDSRVFFGSIKACGEGISLVGASRIIIMDIHLNPSVTRQAIGRAFRPGQERKVYTYRLVASGSPEEEDHLTCFRKECIAKMWFEWNEYQGLDEFEMETVDVNNCGDMFLESDRLKADIVSVCKR